MSDNWSLMAARSNLPVMEAYAGWRQPFNAGGQDVDHRQEVNGMAGALFGPESPRQVKEHRLSILLDKLTEHIKRSKEKLMCAVPVKSEEAPLDLSVKSEIKYAAAAPLVKSEPFACNACGQTFEVHDRLAKHVASRHRIRTPESIKAFECEVCQRRFARSDMLTRHARLHTGIKPYSCSVCGQEFSRSDHLATHHRTHTGEKPYHCPICPYAACRRDMITRHMRTHVKKSQPT